MKKNNMFAFIEGKAYDWASNLKPEIDNTYDTWAHHAPINNSRELTDQTNKDDWDTWWFNILRTHIDVKVWDCSGSYAIAEIVRDAFETFFEPEVTIKHGHDKGYWTLTITVEGDAVRSYGIDYYCFLSLARDASKYSLEEETVHVHYTYEKDPEEDAFCIGEEGEDDE